MSYYGIRSHGQNQSHMKNLIYKLVITVLFVCSAGYVQAQSDLQTFRTNYERLQQIYSPNEPDAIWMADSLANIAPQPYRGVYHFLVAQMLSKRRAFLGMRCDASDIRDVMKWSDSETTANTMRYADTAFKQLFEYGLIPADSFRFMIVPGNVLQIPEMTLADLILMSTLQYPLFNWELNEVTYNAIDLALQYHKNKGNQRILLEYEISKLYFYPFGAEDTPEESPIWQGLMRLEKEYGPQTAIDYQKGVFLHDYLKNTPPSFETVQREYSLLGKTCFDKVLVSSVDTFYKENARLILEDITNQEISLMQMPKNLPPAPKILLPVSYRNLDTLYVSVYRIDKSKDISFWASTRTHINEYIEKSRLQGPMMQQRFVLPNPVPYYFCHTDLFLDSLPKGNYLLLYQTTPQYDTNTVLMFNTLDVTSIKIEEICHANKHYLTFMDAVTGAPLSGLKVTKENLSGMRFYRKTDRNGMLRIHRSEESWRWDHFVNDGPDCVVDYMVYDPMDIIDEDDEKPSIYRGRYYAHYGETIPSAIVLDRPVYRPGQTVYFKVYKVQGHKMDVNSPIIVELRDKADKVVESIELRTNKFGTVSGGFTLPETMTYGGKLCIREKGNVTNWQRFSISAYKLPTFKVELRHVVEPLTIGDSVHFVGRAVSFTGDPIRFANVTVSVYNNRYNSKTRTLYALQTDEKGDFHFTYPTYDTNVYSYYIDAKATVTDINGETQQTAHSLNLDSKPFKIVASMLNSIDLSLHDTLKSSICVTEHYFGHEPMAIPVKVEVFRVEEPDLSRPLIYRYYKKPTHPLYSEEEYHRYFPNYSFIDLTWKHSLWPVKEQVFTTEGIFMKDTLRIPVSKWGTGSYRIQLTATDSLGRSDTTLKFVKLTRSTDSLPTDNSCLSVNILERTSRTVKVSVSTILRDATVYCYVSHGKKTVTNQVLKLSERNQQMTFKIRHSPYNVTVFCFLAHNNQIYCDGRKSFDETFIQKHIRPGTLTLNMIRWNSTLYPGAEERWEMEVEPTERDRKKEPAELLVWMVDSSLYRLNYSHVFNDWIKPYEGSFRYSNAYYWFSDISMDDLTDNQTLVIKFGERSSASLLSKRYSAMNLRDWSPVFTERSPHYSGGFFPDNTYSTSRLSGENIRTTPGRSVSNKDNPFENVRTELDASVSDVQAGTPAPFRIRRDFRETAFFLPQLQTNDSGSVVFTFTVPDQLTTWRFYAQAHTKNLHTGHLSGSIVAKLPMMLQSNAPRFLREGDTMDLRAKITNVSEERLSGTVTLEIVDTIGNQPVGMILDDGDKARGSRDGARPVSTDEPFDIAPGTAQEVHFRIIVPEGISSVTYRLVAKARNYGDGEERTLPVLPKRMLVSETHPFFVPENSDTTLLYNRFRTHITPTLMHERFTVEATTNPAWLAIQTLPALLQPAYESNDRTFATLFAAAMLQKVQKGATQRVTDENLERFLNKSLNKLKNNQLDDGGWSWTGKNIYSRFITCEVVSGFYKLQRMGIKLPAAQKMLAKAVAHADSVQEEAYRDYLRYLESNPKVPYPLDYHDVLYLYTRSFLPVDSAWLSQPYVQCLLTTATQNITKSSYTRQAEMALVLHRIGRMQEAEKIMENLRNQAVTNSNQGMYWRRKYESRYYPWYEAPIEQQALLLEAFSEISPRDEELKAMKQWLLLQKKGNEWQSTRATLAAVYALLLNFTADELEASATTITVGGETFSTAGTADKKGTGYLQHTWNQEEITPSLGEVAVRTDAAHPVIGACHWQYWEEVEKVESEGSGLTISRSYFHQPKTAGGYAEPVTTDNPAHLGERITVRVTVTSDRDLDFVHVTDPRPATFEPTNENKRYFSMRDLYWVEHPRYVRWSQDIRDASTEFFFRHFPKGTFAVEYDVFATQTGEFTTGIPEVECLYAPEWRGHDDNAKVNVR